MLCLASTNSCYYKHGIQKNIKSIYTCRLVDLTARLSATNFTPLTIAVSFTNCLQKNKLSATSLKHTDTYTLAIELIRA